MSVPYSAFHGLKSCIMRAARDKAHPMPCRFPVGGCSAADVAGPRGGGEHGHPMSESAQPLSDPGDVLVDLVGL